MVNAKAVKRDNSSVRYLQGIPMYKCTDVLRGTKLKQWQKII